MSKIHRVGTLCYSTSRLSAVFLVLIAGGVAMQTLPSILLTVTLPVQMAELLPPAMISVFFISIPSCINFVLNPVLSTASDRTRTRFGRRVPYMLFALPLTAVAWPLLAWNQELIALLHLNGAGLLFFFGGGLLVSQFAAMIVGSVYYYYVADTIPEGMLGRFFSLLQLAGAGVMSFLAYFFMADIKRYSGFCNTLFVAIYLLAFLLMFRVAREGGYPPPEAVDKTEPRFARFMKAARGYFRDCFCNPFYLMLFLGTALTQVSTAVRNVFNSVFAFKELGLTEAEFGRAMAIGNLVILGVTLLAGYIADKSNPLLLYIFSGFVVILLNAAGYYYIHDYSSYLVFSIGILAVYAIQAICVVPMFIRLFPREKYGQFSSANAIVNSVFMMIAGYFSGQAVGLFGCRVMFAWDVFFTVIATVILFYVYFADRKLRRQPNMEGQEIASPDFA